MTNKFQGTILIFAAKGKTSIFDLNNKNVATIFNEKQTYKDTITNYKTFHGYFPMPEILDYDDEK